MFELMETAGQQAVIKVLGIGGGGVMQLITCCRQTSKVLSLLTPILSSGPQALGGIKSSSAWENLTKGFGGWNRPGCWQAGGD
ncbi:MAG: hypothetical protein Ct9H300mP14_06460 [Gammaproteobacteria bacterium]|nr:MAG: hypothetical protein Ct9H300mP14_06460 [Gammaproteobacteria bacterium]